MNVISHFTIRSLKHNRKWTIVTIIGIIISTAMIAAVSTFTSSFLALMQNETIAKDGNWHATIFNVSQQNVDKLKNSDFVRETMLSRNIGYSVLKGSENKSKPYLFIKQYDDNSNKNFHVKLISGRMPQNDQELVLSQKVEDNGGIKHNIGEKLTLNIGKRLAPDGSELYQNAPYQPPETFDQDGNDLSEKFIPQYEKAYTIVGIIESPNFEQTWSPGYTAITYLDSKKMNLDDTVNVTLLAEKLNKHFFNEVNEIAKSVGKTKKDVTANTELLRYYGVVEGDNIQSFLYGFAGVIIVIIMLASISLIYNAFAISVSERTRQLGMLASVGATKRQKRKNVYFEGFLIGIIGIPIGILAGIIGIGITIKAIRPLLQSFTTFTSTGLELVISPLAIAVAIVFAVLTILISAWIPARRASKIMPIDAIRQSKEIKLTGKKVKTARLTRILFGFEGEIALKNLKRNRKKYRATVLSLIISIVLFLTVSNYASILKETSQVSTEGYNFDIWVRSSNSSVEDIKNVYSKISGLDLVTESSTIKTSLGHMLLDASQVSETLKQIVTQNDQTKYDLSAQFYCLDENSFDTYAKSIGVDPDDYQNESTPKAIAINYAKNIGDDKYTAGEALSMKPGQQVEILSFASDEEKQPTGMNLTLGAITSQRPMGVLNSSYHTISFIVSEKVFLPLSSKLSDEPQDPDQNLFLNTSDSDKLEKQINDFSKELSKGELFVTNITAKAKSEQDMLLFLGVFVYGFIILISLICLANIFNTISTNIALRRKEFAMLRSVGMTPQGFNKMIRFESIFYGMKALLYGLPLSVVVSLLLFRFQENSFDLGFIFPWVSYCVGIVLIFIIVTATMLYSSAKIKKENIIDALKEENM